MTSKLTILSFEEWYDLYEEEINIELAESGADRELDFDSELAIDFVLNELL